MDSPVAEGMVGEISGLAGGGYRSARRDGRGPRSSESRATISVRSFFSPLCLSCRIEVWLSLDVEFGPSGNVLPNDLCQTLPSHDVVPLRPVLPLTAAIFEPFVGARPGQRNLPTFPTRITLFTLFGIAVLL